MPTLEELFDFMCEVNVFNTLDLWFGYHQLSLRLKDRMKTAFWGVDEDGNDTLYPLETPTLWIENAWIKFQCVMDPTSL